LVIIQLNDIEMCGGNIFARFPSSCSIVTSIKKNGIQNVAV